MNRTTYTAAIGAVGIIAGLGVTGNAAAADADGDDRPCATRAEFRAIKVAIRDDDFLPVGGTTYRKAKKIFDSRGTQIGFGIGEPTFTQGWAQCKNRRNGVSIVFEARESGSPKATWQAVTKVWAR